MDKSDRTKEGIIFNIQKFSVNDGPGIRTTVFLKGCPLSCSWCSNPESQYPFSQICRDGEKCLGCLKCVTVCPYNAARAENGIPHFDIKLCQGCGECVRECPGKALSIEGEKRSVEWIINKVLQDRDFYLESGGGITLSGGEMLFQSDFALNILLASKEEGLNSACETTGCAEKESFLRVMEYVDYILFDMKHWDREKHLEGTGVSNDLILSNMKDAVEKGKNVLPRIPVIPFYNDSIEDAVNFSRTLKSIGLGRCQLLPFHQFGENKYHLLGRNYVYEGVSSLHREDLEEYRKTFISSGIDAFF